MRSSLAGAALALALVCSPAAPAAATPIASLAGLTSITVWEDSRAVPSDPLIQATFGVPDARLTTRLATLDATSNDFDSPPGEFYDVFFSGSDGTPDPLGAYLTIEVVFDVAISNGGNVSRVDLGFTGGATEFADRVASFVVLGPGSAASVASAIDGDLSTTTFLGNTNGTTQRLRLTLGFASSVPEPGAAMLLGVGGALCAVRASRSRRA
jgi:hypothetical protein